MTRKEEQQWVQLEKAKTKLFNWARCNNVKIVEVHFVPMFDFAVEVYVFYKDNADLAQNQDNGVSELIKHVFLKILSDLGYIEYFGDKAKFIFDSDENVINNYQGNYFLRLR